MFSPGGYAFVIRVSEKVEKGLVISLLFRLSIMENETEVDGVFSTFVLL